MDVNESSTHVALVLALQSSAGCGARSGALKGLRNLHADSPARRA